ncbi:hypothetical protein EVAR_57188_1 [Eumeta japonica]|uniref:Uncharacterized protein n=1 Tax=Eumeta variegata TaxID=151549 RepID=A0A4C1Z315_EUMVA|nr:hypothetical protein EVAR_57188_1 [Eumeta japonica]
MNALDGTFAFLKAQSRPATCAPTCPALTQRDPKPSSRSKEYSIFNFNIRLDNIKLSSRSANVTEKRQFRKTRATPRRCASESRRGAAGARAQSS